MGARKELQKSFDELRLLPIDEAAERYYCSRRQLERAVAAGKIEAYKPGAKRLIDLDSADSWFLTTKFRKPVPPGGKRKR